MGKNDTTRHDDPVTILVIGVGSQVSKYDNDVAKDDERMFEERAS